MYVCICNKVTDGAIRDAVSEGVHDLNALSERLNVGTCCGKCKSCAKKVMREARAEMAYVALTNAVTGNRPEPALA